MNVKGKLVGKRALVTGSGTGIGRGIALEFARQGADIVLHYAHSDKGAKVILEEIKAMGRRAAAFKADFDVVDEVVKLGDQAIEFLGGLDCLINNSGITFNMPFLRITQEQFDRLFHVNIRAQFFLTQRVVKDMLEHGGGQIVNLTSVHGLQGAPEHSLYAGTKGAIIAYTRALAVELAHKNIRLNAIAPGWVMVENHWRQIPGFTEEAAIEQAKDSVPVGFAAVPEDIAKLAVFLCTDDARFIIGQTIIADGGSTSLMNSFSDFRHELPVHLGQGYVPGL